MSRVLWSDNFFIKRLILTKRTKTKEIEKGFITYTIMNSFVFFSMIYDATRYARYQSYRQHKHKGDTMETKSYKLYLRIILLINYRMQENLFVNAE